MSGKTRGICYTVLSALIFGFTPLMVKIAYAGGANGITMTFLRGLLALPVLALLARRQTGLALAPEFRRKILILGAASAATTIFLYWSYSFIPVGAATSLHFVYPLLVNLCCRVVFRERLGRMKNFALILGTLGVAFFADTASMTGAAGIAMALASGFFYAFYLVYLSVSGLNRMGYFCLAFYLGLISAAASGMFGWATGQLRFHLTPAAWLIAVVVSLLTAVGATVLFQRGVCLAGSGNASVLSTFEPVTSVVLGALLLKETMTPAKWIGCILILTSVVLIAFAETRPRGANKYG